MLHFFFLFSIIIPAYLEKVTAETLCCKSEYDTLLREMRDPEVKAFFGADEVNRAKESAKKDWISIERCFERTYRLI